MGTKVSAGPQAAGAYVVMRHATAQKRMHFSAAHATYAEAHAEAQRLYAELVGSGAQDPARLGLYVLRIVDRVGCFGGALEHGGKEV